MFSVPPLISDGILSVALPYRVVRHITFLIIVIETENLQMN
jgi:hypothetical protein